MNCTRKILTFRAGFSPIRHTTAGKCVAVAGCVLFLSVLSLTNGLHAQQPEEKPIHHQQEFSKEVSRKARRYQSRIDRRTEKTLVRLSRWETKIRQSLQKVSPETEQQLFGSQRLTFQSMLQEYRERFSSVRKIEAHYDGYLDRLGTTIKYLEGDSTSGVNSELTHLSEQVNQSEYLRKEVAARKRELLSAAAENLRNTAVFRRISKESYYYQAALDNYRDIFSEPGKAEEAVKGILSEVPAFEEFVRQNSRLASLFRVPGLSNTGGGGGVNTAAVLPGLQTRASVQNIIRDRIAAGGPNATAQVQQNLSEAQAKLTSLKDKILKSGTIGNGNDTEIPDFKPNEQRSKTLWQRLEYGFDVQFARSNSILPATTDLGVSLGYRLNDRSTIGAGVSYKLGMGSIQNIRMSSEGVGLRSYLDWKIKGQWYATGGYELNYRSAFKDISELTNAAWQRSGLIGVSRQYKAGKKMKGQVKLMYDFMARLQHPHGSPIIFRMGYKL